jgi:plastocyanin
MKKTLCLLLLPLMTPLMTSGAFADATVVQKGRRFNPGEITIPSGANLTFTNNDEFIHQIYVTGLFDSDERVPGQTLVEAFPNAGTFEVHCHIHPRMKLVVRVN